MPASGHLCRHITDDLLLTVGRGDLIAFADLYDQTVTAVYRLLRGVLGDSAEAEQATERVYTQVWRMAPSHDPVRLLRADVDRSPRTCPVGQCRVVPLGLSASVESTVPVCSSWSPGHILVVVATDVLRLDAR